MTTIAMLAAMVILSLLAIETADPKTCSCVLHLPERRGDSLAEFTERFFQEIACAMTMPEAIMKADTTHGENYHAAMAAKARWNPWTQDT